MPERSGEVIGLMPGGIGGSDKSPENTSGILHRVDFTGKSRVDRQRMATHLVVAAGL
jgi:hypothetical protein